MGQGINIVVAIIWRPTEDRKPAFNYVKNWYQKNLPEATIIEVDSGSEIFSRSGSRNSAVREARKLNADVVIVNDADTFPEIDALQEAIFDCLNDNLVHLPYTEYRSLQASGSEQLLNGALPGTCDHSVVYFACSGIYVLKPEVWWKHYGQDERFASWGYEDSAWLVAHKTLLGSEPIRHEGRAFAITHNTDEQQNDFIEANAALCYKYLKNDGNMSGMRKLAMQGLANL
jgi:hypothetical protein